MGAAYHIMGRTVPSHFLALGTIGLVALIAIPNPFSSKKGESIDFNAGSKDEEKFIKEYLAKHAGAPHKQ
ncbi:hypothetical protein HG535_0C03110 [Zygotorulaspora mrakii]|uniref:ATP synthase subunit K, mitochondrial n=1 Tax=Zygotorulaspora mrakii TaxID=42260 RepID=A0A7H9B1V3_ZYGMR|nr:uncharacterized protein HG535_0C03110 [Zygotorulaspora mrakii]QLG71959.1 hypothetical protein HG535_0C03110 [Zygotorulaspora mrakii]